MSAIMWIISVEVYILVWFISLNQLPSSQEQCINLPYPQIVVQCIKSNYLCHPLEDIEEKCWCSAPSPGDSCNIGDTFALFSKLIT